MNFSIVTFDFLFCDEFRYFKIRPSLFLLSALFPDSFWTCSENPRAVLEREKEALNKAIDQTNSIRKQRDELAGERDVASSRVLKLQAELAPASKTIQDLQTRLTTLASEKANHEKTAVKLQAEVDKILQRNAELVSRKAKLDEESKRLKAETEELSKAKDLVSSGTAGLQNELDTAQATLQNTSRLLRTTFELNLHSLACFGATVANQPTLALDQIQLAIGWFLHFLEFFEFLKFSATIFAIDLRDYFRNFNR